MKGTPDEFKTRVDGKKWPIFKTTHHRNELRIGDVIMFYLAGKENMKILGTAKISSKLKTDSEFDYSIDISDIDIWKKPKPLKKFLDSLGFIRNKDKWGMSLQGGIIPLPKKDYAVLYQA